MTPLAYEKLTYDKVNRKLIEGLPGLPGYYRFVSPADMPQGRFVHYLHLVKRLSLNVDEAMLNRYVEAFKQAFEARDAGKFHSAVFMLQDTLKNVTPVETYYWIAALMYFRKDEDLSTFDFDVNKRKVDYFKGLPNQTFFLATLIKSLQNSGGASLEEIENYLRQSQTLESSYSRILTSMISPG